MGFMGGVFISLGVFHRNIFSTDSEQEEVE